MKSWPFRVDLVKLGEGYEARLPGCMEVPFGNLHRPHDPIQTTTAVYTVNSRAAFSAGPAFTEGTVAGNS